MPGASLESVEGDAFIGNVKIKLGPISLSYRGQARYITKNIDTRTIVIEGTGKDPKEAAPPVPPSPPCSPKTAAAPPWRPTDLDVTGRPAQFGRGVMNDVANKLVGQVRGQSRNAAHQRRPGSFTTPGHPARQPPHRHLEPRPRQACHHRRRRRRPGTSSTSSPCSASPQSPAAGWPPHSSSPTCSCWAGPLAGSATGASPPAEGHPMTRTVTTVNPATGDPRGLQRGPR